MVSFLAPRAHMDVIRVFFVVDNNNVLCGCKKNNCVVYLSINLFIFFMQLQIPHPVHSKQKNWMNRLIYLFLLHHRFFMSLFSPFSWGLFCSIHICICKESPPYSNKSAVIVNITVWICFCFSARAFLVCFWLSPVSRFFIRKCVGVVWNIGRDAHLTGVQVEWWRLFFLCLFFINIFSLKLLFEKTNTV